MTTVARRALAALATLLIVLGVTACQATPATSPSAAGTPVTITHAQGTTTLTGTPRRVVVMEYGSLDTLQALGLADVVVGLPKANVPAFLSAFKADRYADVGTLAEPNYEAINALKPDLVIVGYRSAKTYGEMSKYFPTLDITPTTKEGFLAGVGESARLVGQAFGRQAQVEEKLAALAQQADALGQRGKDAGTGLVVMTSAGKVTMHGVASRYGAIHTVLGVKPAVAEVSADSHGQPISFEFIAETNPDHLFVVDRDAAVGEKGAAAREVLDNAVVRQSKAWQQGKVTYLDGSRWYIAIHGLANAAAMLAEAGTALDR